MSKPKVHYAAPIDEEDNRAICGFLVEVGLNTTEDRDLVTCKRCQRIVFGEHDGHRTWRHWPPERRIFG